MLRGSACGEMEKRVIELRPGWRVMGMSRVTVARVGKMVTEVVGRVVTEMCWVLGLGMVTVGMDTEAACEGRKGPKTVKPKI